MKKKVVFIIPTLDPGGIETYLYRFLLFIKGDFDITIIVRNKSEGKLFKDYSDLDVKIIFLPLGYFNLSNFFKYYLIFKNENFDVVCDFNGNFAGIPLLLSSLTGTSKRIAFYRQGKNHFKPSLIKNLYNNFSKKLVFHFSTFILSNSKAALDFFFINREDDLRFKVIYNGIDKKEFHFNTDNGMRKKLNIPKNAFVVVHSGRLDPAKNHETIIKVGSNLIKKYDDIYFLVLGLDTEKLKIQIENEKIKNRFITLGYRNDVSNILSIANLFYFPSISEGQPNALLEAMVMGLPIVASNIPPIKEAVCDKLKKYLIPPKDIGLAIKTIENIYRRKIKTSDISCKEWAIKQYNSESRFNEFKKLIIK